MNSAVFFAGVSDYDKKEVEEAIEGFFTQIEGAKALKPGVKVLLKPNLLSKSSPEKAITTHPEVLRGVIRACQKRGVTDILVADSAGGLYNPKQCKALYKGCGIEAVAEEEGVSLYTQCEAVDKPWEGKVVHGFRLLKPAVEADVIINLPKFKTHVMTGMTASCKNMFGVIPGLEKSQWHTIYPQRDGFGEMLVDLYECIPPTFSILDGILAMEGDGPGGGTPRELGILMASEDSFSMDLAVAEMMGYEGNAIPYLKVAMARGLCAEKFDPSLAQGDSGLFAPIPQWVLPESYQGGGEANTTFSQFLPKPLKGIGEKLEASLAPRPYIIRKDCIHCLKCSEICSKDAIDFPNNRGKIRKKDCISCFCCHEVCPVRAIAVKKSKLFSH